LSNHWERLERELFCSSIRDYSSSKTLAAMKIPDL
jgi:hypothetical protein